MDSFVRERRVEGWSAGREEAGDAPSRAGGMLGACRSAPRQRWRVGARGEDSGDPPAPVWSPEGCAPGGGGRRRKKSPEQCPMTGRRQKSLFWPKRNFLLTYS